MPPIKPETAKLKQCAFEITRKLVKTLPNIGESRAASDALHEAIDDVGLNRYHKISVVSKTLREERIRRSEQ